MNPSVAELRSGAQRLAIGMMAAQAAALVATPLLTRLYSPAQFGVYALFLAIVTTVAPIAALRFDNALPLATTDSEAGGIAGLGLVAAALLALVVGTLAFPLARLALYYSGNTAVASAIHWAAPALFLTAVFQVGSAWQLRAQSSLRAAQGRAAQGVGTALAQLALGALRSGLVIGDLIGRALSGVWVLPSALRAIRAAAPQNYRALAVRYRGFATLASVAVLIYALNTALPAILVTAVLGTSATGLLLLAQRVAALPATLLSSPVSQMFALQLATTERGAARVALFDATLREVLRTAVLPSLAIAVLAPLTFGILFGAEWKTAGTVTAALVPFYLAQVLSASTVSAVDVLQLHAQRILRELIFLSVSSILLYTVLLGGWSLAAVAAAFSVFGVCFYAGSLWWLRSRLVQEVR